MTWSWPRGQASPPILLGHQARVWVGQTDPTQTASSHSLPLSLALESSLANPSRLCHRLAIPADSGEFRRCHLGRVAHLRALFHLHQTVLPAASSPRRSRAGSHSRIASLSPLTLTPCRLSVVLAVLLRGDPGVCEHPGDAVLLVCRGEDSLGQPLASRTGTALPCRPDEHLGVSECVILLSTPLFLLRPWSLAIWPRPVSQAHRLILCSC
jgi:hypothetical protein